MSSALHYGVKVATVAALLALPLAPPVDVGATLGLSRWTMAAVFMVVVLAAAAWDTTQAVLLAILIMAVLVRAGGP